MPLKASRGIPVSAAELRLAAKSLPTSDWEWVQWLLIEAAREIDKLTKSLAKGNSSHRRKTK